MALVIGEVKPGLLKDDDRSMGTVIPLPPPNGGAVGWGQVYLSFACDFGDALLRTAIWGQGYWRLGELVVTSAGGRVSLPIQDGDEKVCVARIPAGPGDTGSCPLAYMIETTLRA